MDKTEWDWHEEGVTAKLDLNSEEAKAIAAGVVERQEAALIDLARDVWGPGTETAFTRKDIESIRAEYDRMIDSGLMRPRVRAKDLFPVKYYGWDEHMKRQGEGITRSLRKIWIEALYPDQKDEPLAQ